jgi:hypothetical protein
MPRVSAARPIALPAFGALAALALAAEFAIARSAAFAREPAVLSLAVTFDLLVGLPLLYYGLVVRRGRAPASTLVPVLFASAGLAHLILPPGGRAHLARAEALLPFAELALLPLAALRARAVARAYAAARPSALDAVDALHDAFARALGQPRLGAFLASELTVFFFALLGPFLRPPPDSARRRSFAAAPGLGGLVFGALVLFASEGLVVHLFVEHFSAPAAWILTALTAYSALWLVADYELVRLRPIALAGDRLRVRVGARWRVDVDRALVVALEGPPREGDGALDLSASGAPTCTLALAGPVEVKGPFGIVRSASRLALQVDDPSALGRALGL